MESIIFCPIRYMPILFRYRCIFFFPIYEIVRNNAKSAWVQSLHCIHMEHRIRQKLCRFVSFPFSKAYYSLLQLSSIVFTCFLLLIYILGIWWRYGCKKRAWEEDCMIWLIVKKKSKSSIQGKQISDWTFLTINPWKV